MKKKILQQVYMSVGGRLLVCLYFLFQDPSIFEHSETIIIISLRTNTNLRLVNCILAARNSTSLNLMYTLSLLLFLRKAIHIDVRV